MMIQRVSWPWALAGLYLVWLASLYIRRYRKSQKIRRLGLRAPAVKTVVPLGLDFPWYAAAAVTKNETLEFWQWMFAHVGASQKGSYTVELNILENSMAVMTADPENIKAILTTQFQNYGKGYQFHQEWAEFLGDSIFTTDGKQWHDSRQLMRPMFVREKVADLELFEKHVSKLIKLLGPGDGSRIPFHRVIYRYTLDAATDYLFGQSAGSLDTEHSDFLVAFDEVQRVQSLTGRLGPLALFYPMKSFREGLRTMEKFIQPFITATLQMTPEELETKLAKSNTFIHALARFTRDRKVIRDQLVGFLLAGRDSTACTLSWVFLELGRNPQVVRKLQEEISASLGNDGKAPTYQTIKDMKYLNHIIHETLRLYPAVPFNVRASLADTTLPRGGGPDGTQPLGILKDTVIAYSTLMMQRRRDLYPPVSEAFPYDPLEWVPERWATWTPKSWNYIPFNGGPRICIGQQFAIVEIAYTIVRIFQTFDSLVDFGNNPIMHTDIVLTPAEGVNIGFVKNGYKV